MLPHIRVGLPPQFSQLRCSIADKASFCGDSELTIQTSSCSVADTGYLVLISCLSLLCARDTGVCHPTVSGFDAVF